jgi:SNF2 family DNA or RNA helicase
MLYAMLPCMPSNTGGCHMNNNSDNNSARVIADCDDALTHITLDADARMKDVIASLPGSRWSRTHGWSLPLTWSSCLALRATFGENLVIGSGLREWAQEARNTQDSLGALRHLLELPQGQWQGQGKELPEALFPHQVVDAHFLAKAERAIFASEVGVGKSAAVISALRLLDDPFPALVVCPSSVKQSWAREFARWFPEKTVQVVAGTPTQRRKQITSDTDVLVMNYESVRVHSRLAHYGSTALRRCSACGGAASVTPTRCQVHPRDLNTRPPFHTVIADEAHRMKTPQAALTLAVKAVSAPSTRYRFALTGTPIANTVLDLWSLLNFIDPYEWPTRSKWVDRFLLTMRDVWGGLVVHGVRPEREAEFEATTMTRVRRMTKAAVLPFLPPIMEEWREVEMSRVQETAYRELSEGMIVNLESGVLTATDTLTQAMRLLQLTSSYGEVDDAGGFTLSAPSSKLDEFMKDLEDFEGRAMVVFCVSRQLALMLSARLTKAKIPHGMVVGQQSDFERHTSIDDFQAGKTRIIIVTVAAGGAGLTLTAADTMVFLQRPWSHVDYTQAKGRAHRLGSEQHESIKIVHYVVPNTLEQAVVEALEGKGLAMEALVRDKDLLKRAIVR